MGVGNKNISKAGIKTQFSATNQPNGAGRKKKIYTVIKEMGYSGEDIKTAFGELAFYNLKELDRVKNDEKKPIITRIIANQFGIALDKGDWNRIKEILEHVMGKPQQVIDHKVEHISREDREARIVELTSKMHISKKAM